MLVLAALTASAQDSQPDTSTTTTTLQRGAHESQVGVGLGSGFGVAGITGKYEVTEMDAVQATVGGYWLGGAGAGFGVDYVRALPIFAETRHVTFNTNVGGGGTFGISGPAGIGVAGLVGIQMRHKQLPFDAALEYRPGFYVGSRAGFQPLGVAGSVRYWF